MSYDIRIVDKNTRETILAAFEMPYRAGTYCLNSRSVKECAFNITYNYYAHLCKALGSDKSVRCLYGKTVKETIPLLESAISKLGDDVAEDYWKPTEGNAKEALRGLLVMAKAANPDSVWEGD